MRNQKTRELVLCALFTALTAVGAFIKIPVPVVPFTLQFLFTMLAGLLLGGRLGAISVGAYAVLGLLGLPIFTEGGGFWYLLKPSFGYILGANLVGLTIVYGMGMVYYYIICNFVLGTPIGLWPLVLYCFLLAVPGDLCLCVLAAAVTVRLRVALPGLSRA